MRFALWFIALGLCQWAQAVPEVLIVQRSAVAKEKVALEIPIATMLAEELDTEGKVSPVVWSLTDPLFRAWVDAGKVSAAWDHPTDEQIRSVAQSLHIAYVFLIDADRENENFYPRAVLLKGGRSIWKQGGDQRSGDARKYKEKQHTYVSMTVSTGTQLDWENTARSLARTWATLLHLGPFKTLPSHPKRQTPEPEKGTAPTKPTAPPPTSTPDESWIAKEQELERQGLLTERINLLREAIDADPFQIKPREMLIALYLSKEMNGVAAEEAQRAAVIAPDRVDLRVLSARAWLQGGKLAEAQADLNEALAREPKNANLQLVLGQLSLEKGAFQSAIDAFSSSLETLSSPEGRVGRAVAYAVLGRAAESASDLKAILPADINEASYGRVTGCTERVIEVLLGELREIALASRSKPKDPETISNAERAERVASAMADFLSAFPVPAKHAKSHERRVLAHKLLAQAAGEALAFAKLADEETGAEATLSLTEAMKQFPLIRRQYESEGH